MVFDARTVGAIPVENEASKNPDVSAVAPDAKPAPFDARNMGAIPVSQSAQQPAAGLTEVGDSSLKKFAAETAVTLAGSVPFFGRGLAESIAEGYSESEPDGVPDRTWGEAGMDAVASVAKGGADLVMGANELADQALSPSARQSSSAPVGLSLATTLGTFARDKLGLPDPHDIVRDTGKAAVEYWGGQKSDPLKQREKLVAEADGFLGTLGASIQNPSTIVSVIAEQALPTLLQIGGAGKVSQMVTDTVERTVAGPLIRGTAQEAGTKAAAAAAIGFEGAQGGGMAGVEVREHTMRMPIEELRESPLFMEAARNHGESAARKILAEELATQATAMAGAATMLLSKYLGDGSRISDAVQGKALDGVRPVAVRIASEAGSEALQEPAEGMTADLAKSRVDGSVDPFDVNARGKESALGLLAGAGQAGGIEVARAGLSSVGGRPEPDVAQNPADVPTMGDQMSALHDVEGDGGEGGAGDSPAVDLSAQQAPAEREPSPYRSVPEIMREKGLQPAPAQVQVPQKAKTTVQQIIEQQRQRKSDVAAQEQKTAPYRQILQQMQRESSSAPTDGRVDVDRDDVLTAIAKLGGLDPAYLGGEVDVATMRNMQRVGRPIVRKPGEGVTPDHMAESLMQEGFAAPNGDPLDPNSLMELIDSASRGDKIFSVSSNRRDMIDPDGEIARRWFRGDQQALQGAIQKHIDGKPLTPNQQFALDDVTNILRGGDDSIYRERAIESAADMDPLQGEIPPWYGQTGELDTDMAEYEALASAIAARSVAQGIARAEMTPDEAREHAEAMRQFVLPEYYQAAIEAGVPEALESEIMLMDALERAIMAGVPDEDIQQLRSEVTDSAAVAAALNILINSGVYDGQQESEDGSADAEWRYEPDANQWAEYRQLQGQSADAGTVRRAPQGSEGAGGQAQGREGEAESGSQAGLSQVGRSGADRRATGGRRSNESVAVTLQKYMDGEQLTESEWMLLATHSEVVPLRNKREFKRAWVEHQRKAASDPSYKMPKVVFIDADSLKWFNDNISHAAGDGLLEAVSEALLDANADAFHVSGDEFLVIVPDEQAGNRLMPQIQASLSQKGATFTAMDGRQATINGYYITYGIGDSVVSADAKMQASKKQKEAQGERAARGEQPKSVVFAGQAEANRGSQERADAGVSDAGPDQGGGLATEAGGGPGGAQGGAGESGSLTQAEANNQTPANAGVSVSGGAIELTQQTEKQREAREHSEKRAAKGAAEAELDAENKRKADSEAQDFRLAGSDRDADVAAAGGQQDIFAAAANEAATSPENNLPDPTPAQIEAGNYKKGHVTLHGLNLTIENPRGSNRSGTDPDGNRWEQELAHHYGYIKRTEGADGEHVDVFIGPDTDSEVAFVIDQVNADGSFDEHKVMLGFKNQKAAQDGYRANYQPGWKVGPTTRMSIDELKSWLANGDTSKPVKADRFAADPGSAPLFSVAPDQRSERAAWAGFPPVVRHAGLNALKVRAGYEQAKSGDAAAALKIAQAVVTEDAISQLTKLIDGRSPVIVPVLAEEQAGRNKLPAMFAEVLADRLGLKVDYSILQAKKVGRTGAGSDYRLAHIPVFAGQVKADQDYLIVDDTLAMGGTIASLRGYIENRGGRVIGASVMTAHEGAVDLPIKPGMLRQIREKHGDELEAYWQEQFGYGLDGLTQGEAGHLRAAKDVDAIRTRIAAARDAAVGGVGEGRTSQAAPPEVTDNDQSEARPSAGLSASGLRGAIRKALGERLAGSVKVVQSVADLPRAAGLQSLSGTSSPVGSQAFRGWFGDSKVVDAEGEPMVVYHGTNADFSQFDISMAGQTDSGWYGRGFYFTPNANWTFAEDAADSRGGAANVMPVYVSLRDPIYAYAHAEQGSDLVARAKERGKDGVIVQFDPGHEKAGQIAEVIAFRPEQIKSAIGNNGNYDPINPDIRESRAAGSIEGLYDPATGDVYLVADSISSEDRAAWVAWHELFHRGIRSAPRDGAKPFGQDAEGLRQTLNRAGLNKHVKALADAIAQDRDMRPSDRLIAIEEALAELNAADETGDYGVIQSRYGVSVPASMLPGIRGHLARFFDAIRAILKKLGIARGVVLDSDVMGIIRGARAGYGRSGDVQRQGVSEKKGRKYKARSEGQGDLFAAVEAAEGAATEQEKKLVFEARYKAEMIETGSILLDVRPLSIPQHAATFLRPYSMYAQEVFLVVPLDRDKKPMGILRMGKGTIDGAAVYAEVVAGDLLMMGAQSYWIAHNHPSGRTDPSQADRTITKRIDSHVMPFGIFMEGHVILGDAGYSALDQGGEVWESGDRYAEPGDKQVVRIYERVMTYVAPSEVRSKAALTSPESASAMLREVFDGAPPSAGVIALSNKHEAADIVMVDRAEAFGIDKERLQGFMRKIFAANSAAVIVFGDNKDAISNLMRVIRNVEDLRILDGFLYEGGQWRSYGKAGWDVPADKAFLSVSESKGAPRQLPPNQSEVAERQEGFLSGIASQPIDRMFRALFDATGQVDSHGRWKMGVALDSKVRDVIANWKPHADGRFAWIGPVLESARAGLLDRYGLSSEYKARWREAEAEERRRLTQGLEILETLRRSNVGPAESKVLQAMLTGEQIPEGEWGALAEPIRRAIDDLGQELVNLGLLTAEAYQRNRGAYLHRSYLKHEQQFTPISRWVNELMTQRRRKITGDALRARGIDAKVSMAQLQRGIPTDWWGTRREAGQADHSLKGSKFILFEKLAPAGEGIDTMDGMEEGRPRKRRVLERNYWPADLPLPAKYQAWENRGKWEVRSTIGKNVVLWRDYSKSEREKMGEILDARYNIAKTFEQLSHDIALGKFFSDIAKNPEWFQHNEPEGAEVIDAVTAGRTSLFTAVDWVRVPDAKIPKSGASKWGALSGGYVRAEIWRDLNELDKMQTTGMWRQLLTQWKLNKTARSPVVHMNNVMSNLMLMDMADVRMPDFVRGLSAYINKSDDYQDAIENGAFEGTFINEEIRQRILKPILDDILKDQTGGAGMVDTVSSLGKFFDGVQRAIKTFDAAMTSTYQIEDEIFRMATYMRRLQLGDSPAEAAAIAREQFLDYDIRAPWVNAARRTVLPFISYTYRAVPVVAQSIVHRPWKLAKYATLAYLAQAFAYALAPGDEDEEERTMRRDQQGMTWLGTPRMMRMPYRDEYGNPVFLDIRRWIPAGDVFDLNQGQSAIPVPAPLQFGGPLMLAAELALNKQAFTGREIVSRDTDTALDVAAKVGNWAYKSWMPSAAYIPGSHYWSKTEMAVTGARDIFGQQYSVEQVLLSSLGIKLSGHDVDAGYYYNALGLAREQRQLMFEMRQLAKDHERGIIGSGRFERSKARVMEKLNRLGDRMQELQGQ